MYIVIVVGLLIILPLSSMLNISRYVQYHHTYVYRRYIKKEEEGKINGFAKLQINVICIEASPNELRLHKNNYSAVFSYSNENKPTSL